MPGVLVLISVILFIAAYVLYDKRDETEGAKYSKRADAVLSELKKGHVSHVSVAQAYALIMIARLLYDIHAGLKQGTR